MITQHIRHLCFLVSPSTVECPVVFRTFLAFATGVSRIVVFSVYAVPTGWSFAHIVKKCLKRIAPSFAYFYTSSFIPFKRIVAAVFGSTNYITPGMIFNRLRHSVSFFEWIFASAAFCVILNQAYRGYYRLIAAFTNTLPKLIFVFIGADNLFSYKISKFSIGKIADFTHVYA